MLLLLLLLFRLTVSTAPTVPTIPKQLLYSQKTRECIPPSPSPFPLLSPVLNCLFHHLTVWASCLTTLSLLIPSLPFTLSAIPSVSLHVLSLTINVHCVHLSVLSLAASYLSTLVSLSLCIPVLSPFVHDTVFLFSTIHASFLSWSLC